jgi:hypothetical protein
MNSVCCLPAQELVYLKEPPKLPGKMNPNKIKKKKKGSK